MHITENTLLYQGRNFSSQSPSSFGSLGVSTLLMDDLREWAMFSRRRSDGDDGVFGHESEDGFLAALRRMTSSVSFLLSCWKSTFWETREVICVDMTSIWDVILVMDACREEMVFWRRWILGSISKLLDAGESSGTSGEVFVVSVAMLLKTGVVKAEECEKKVLST